MSTTSYNDYIFRIKTCDFWKQNEPFTCREIISAMRVESQTAHRILGLMLDQNLVSKSEEIKHGETHVRYHVVPQTPLAYGSWRQHSNKELNIKSYNPWTEHLLCPR